MKLPTFDGQAVAVNPMPSGVRADPSAFSAGANQAAEGFNRLSGDMIEMSRRLAHQSAAMEASKALAQTRLDMTKDFSDATQAAPPGALDFAKTYLQRFDEKTQPVLDSLSPLAQGYYTRRLELLKGQLGDHAIAFEAQQNLALRQSNLNDTVNLNANVVRSDPSQFEGALGETTGAIAGAGLPAEQERKATDHVKNLLTSSMFQGLNDNDPEQARSLLDSGKYDGFLQPGEKNGLLKANDQRLAQIAADAERDRRQAQAVAQANVQSLYADEQSSIRDTGRGQGQLTPALVRAAYPEDTYGDHANLLLTRLDRDRNFYNARQSVALTSPTEDAALVAKFQPQGEDYADQAQNRDLLIQAIQSKAKLATQDPAGYVMQASPALKAAYQAAQADPTKLRDALALSASLQSKIGIAPENQSVLPAGQAQVLAGQIAAAPADQAATMLQDNAARYGGQWPAAFKDLVAAKLPTGYQMLAQVDDPSTRTQLVEALRAGHKTLHDLVGADAAKQIDPAVSTNLAPFLGTLAYAPNGSKIADTWQQNAEALAYRLKTQGMSPADAASAATKGLLSQWDISSGGNFNARAPKGAQEQVESFAGTLLDGLKPADLQPPPPAAGEVPLTPDQRGQAYLRDGVQSGGLWVTNAGDDGWIMLDQSRKPVLKADGTPLGFSFKDAATAAAQPPAPKTALDFQVGP